METTTTNDLVESVSVGGDAARTGPRTRMTGVTDRTQVHTKLGKMNTGTRTLQQACLLRPEAAECKTQQNMRTAYVFTMGEGDKRASNSARACADQWCAKQNRIRRHSRVHQCKVVNSMKQDQEGQ